MKTLPRWVLPLSLAAGGLLICLPSVLAAPGGSVTVGTAGVAPANGGHAAAAAPVGTVHSAGPASGFHAGPVGNGGAAGYRGPGPASGGVRAVPGPMLNPGFPGNVSGQRLGTNPAGLNRVYAPVARVNNAWTDPLNSRVVNAGGISRYNGHATAARRTDPVYSRPGNYRNRGNHRYYYNNFPYGVYYPYLYSNYGFGGYGNDGYVGGVAAVSGLNTDNGVADLGAPDFSNNSNNYYSYVAPDQNASNANPPPAATPTQPLPDAPAVGPDGPSAANKSAGGVAPGPDSLVEAVQTELARRGYFEGKPDSMYSPATREAIRRFQTDQGLPATGRINEATLHALRLD